MKEHEKFNFSWLVWRNLSNRPFRTLATTLAFAIIAATLFAALYLTGGATRSLESGMNRLGADILVVPEEYNQEAETVILMGEPSSFFFHDSGYTRIAGIPGVARASPQIYIATLQGQACCSGEVQLVAIDPANDFTIAPWLKENPGVTLGKDDVIVGGRITGDIGSDLRFYGHVYHIVGRLAKTGTGVDMSVFTRIEDADVMAAESGEKAVRRLTIPAGMVSAVLVKLGPEVSAAAVSEEIRRAVPGTKTITPDGLLSAVNGQLGMITRILLGSALAVTVVSVPLIGFVSALVARERKREIAIFRALGAAKRDVAKLVFAESFGIAIAGGLAGIGSAAAILVLFQDFIAGSLNIPFLVPPVPSILTAGFTSLSLCVGIGGIAALGPALQVIRSDPYATIRKGEP